MNQRRKLLKMGGVSTLSSIPTMWIAPNVDSVILPAHAQTTDQAVPNEDDGIDPPTTEPGSFSWINQRGDDIQRAVVNDINPTAQFAALEYPQRLLVVCISLSSTGKWSVNAAVKNWLYDVSDNSTFFDVFSGEVNLDDFSYAGLQHTVGGCNEHNDGFECRLYQYDDTFENRSVLFDYRIINQVSHPACTTPPGNIVQFGQNLRLDEQKSICFDMQCGVVTPK